MGIFKKWLFTETNEIYKTICLLPFLSFGCTTDAVEVLLRELLFINNEGLIKSLMGKLLESFVGE